MALMRLDKLLADMGIATRSELKDIIKHGRVLVDGTALTAPDAKVDADKSTITLDGEELSYKRFVYYMMDKPCGLLSATRDGKQRTVLDMLSPELRRCGLFPVGRLDKDTSGLLLLTNDGNFAHRVISPKFEIKKRYYARVDGTPDQTDVDSFESGILLRDGTNCLPAKLELLSGNECFVTVVEGKYHQVKRMLASCGKPVLELRRLSIGGLKLPEGMIPGEYRELKEQELCKIFEP